MFVPLIEIAIAGKLKLYKYTGNEQIIKQNLLNIIFVKDIYLIFANK